MKQFLTKMMAVAVVLALALACVPMSVFAAYENTHVNTGDMAADIVSVAMTQVGYLEGSYAGTTAGRNNVQKYGLWYDQNVDNIGVKAAPWCAAFVSWCANQAGVPSSIVYYHAYCPSGVNWFKNQGRFQYAASRGGSYVPKAGDIVYFAPSGSSTSSHIGIVRYVSGGYVYTVEGNTSGQKGEDNDGGGVFAKSYALSYNRLLGYGIPNYETTPGATASKVGTYKITASSLNVRSSTDTSSDANIVGELKNGELVYVSELNGNWGKVKLADGTFGWASVGDYGDYIGVDILGGTGSSPWGDFSATLDTEGRLTVTNNGTTDTAAYDFAMPIAIGTKTTPYLTLQVTPNYGEGFYFGITQKGSGYFMMRDCNSGDELVNATTAPFMTNTETLSIDLRDWWQPEENYQIDSIRFYIAPSSSITINYAYFAEESGVVSDTTYNIVRGDGSNPDVPAGLNENLMLPDTLRIADTSKSGSYTYQNGMLTVVSNDANGYEVVFDVNKEFAPETFKRFLYSVDARTKYDIQLVVTTSEGDRTVTLVDDFWPGITGEKPADGYIPAKEQSAGLDLLSVYTYNQVMPSDGVSIIKTVTVKVGGEGTVIVNAIQIGEDDALHVYDDGVTKTDSSPATTPDPIPGTLGNVDGDDGLTTADARIILQYSIGAVELDENALKLADYNQDGEITTADARDVLIATL